MPTISTQRVIAPAPSTIVQASSSMSKMYTNIATVTTGSTKPIQTLVHTGGKNVQYISFVPMSAASGASMSTGQHPIANQAGAAKLITSTSGTKYVPLKPMTVGGGGVQSLALVNSKPIIATAFPGSSSISAQAMKQNLVHLTATNITNSSGAQKVLINPHSFKISAIPGSSVTKLTSVMAGGNVGTSLAAGSMGSGGTVAKPTSIWMLPKQQMISKMEGQGSGTGPTTNIQLQVTNKPIVVNSGGSNIISSGATTSKFVPIAPNPSQASNIKTEDQKAQTMVMSNAYAKLPLL